MNSQKQSVPCSAARAEHIEQGNTSNQLHMKIQSVARQMGSSKSNELVSSTSTKASEGNHGINGEELSKEAMPNESTLENVTADQGDGKDEMMQESSAEEQVKSLEYQLPDDVVEYIAEY